MQGKIKGIRTVAAAADYSNYEGYGVTLSVVNGVTTATLSASATVPIDGIILQSDAVSCDIAILGNFEGELDVKLSGAVNDGAKICQAADGTFVTDAGAGARVQVGIMADTGVATELRKCFPRTPLILA